MKIDFLIKYHNRQLTFSPQQFRMAGEFSVARGRADRQSTQHICSSFYFYKVVIQRFSKKVIENFTSQLRLFSTFSPQSTLHNFRQDVCLFIGGLQNIHFHEQQQQSAFQSTPSIDSQSVTMLKVTHQTPRNGTKCSLEI
jgi:hypothetical protein